MDSLKCEAFLTAVEHGSFTAAAQLLGYTQPGITRMIRSLEAETGFPLLVRSPRGVVPTENGKAMLPLFREIVRARQSAEELSSEIRGMLSGVLTIGSYYSVSAMVLPDILRQFQRDYPQIRIKLREGGNQEMAQWLGERSIDLSFSARPGPETVCDWLPLLEDELMAWLPEEHPMAKASAFPVKALDGAPFIITMPGQDTDIDRLLKAHSVTPDLRFSTADAYTTYRMVEAGLGISFNNRLIFQKWQGRVAALPFDPPQTITLGISVPSLREASPAAKRFIECVRQALASLTE